MINLSLGGRIDYKKPLYQVDARVLEAARILEGVGFFCTVYRSTCEGYLRGFKIVDCIVRKVDTEGIEPPIIEFRNDIDPTFRRDIISLEELRTVAASVYSEYFANLL